MGTIKDRNGMDLTEAEKIKKRWKEYTEELYKKIFMTQIAMMVRSPTTARHPGMQSQVGLRKHHYEQASGGDGIPAELFQILNLENSPVATGLEKVSFHSNPKERQCQRMLRLPHNCTHLTH